MLLFINNKKFTTIKSKKGDTAYVDLIGWVPRICAGKRDFSRSTGQGRAEGDKNKG